MWCHGVRHLYTATPPSFSVVERLHCSTCAHHIAAAMLDDFASLMADSDSSAMLNAAHLEACECFMHLTAFSYCSPALVLQREHAALGEAMRQCQTRLDSVRSRTVSASVPLSPCWRSIRPAMRLCENCSTLQQMGHGNASCAACQMRSLLPVPTSVFRGTALQPQVCAEKV